MSYSKMYNETPAERKKQLSFFLSRNDSTATVFIITFFRTEHLNMHDTNSINHALTTKKFNTIINQLFKKYVIQHLVLLDFCEKMEDLFSPVLLVKIRLNMLYYCMMIITVVLLVCIANLFIFCKGKYCRWRFTDSTYNIRLLSYFLKPL